MRYESETKNLIERLQAVPGRFVISPGSWLESKINNERIRNMMIVHEDVKDNAGKSADVLVSLLKHEYRDTTNQSVWINNGVVDLHHIAYMLNLSHKFLMEVEIAGRAQLEILTFGFEDNWAVNQAIVTRVRIRDELEKLLSD